MISLGLAISSISLPRRPDVVFQSCKVDRQRTVSALRRYTWSWIESLLQQASVKNDLDLDDIPCADQTLRADELDRQYDGFEVDSTLLRSLLCGYKGKLGWSWLVTIVRCLISIMPYWTMLRTLEVLENRELKFSHQLELLGLVLGIAIFNLIDSVRFLLLSMRSSITTVLTLSFMYLVDGRVAFLVLCLRAVDTDPCATDKSCFR